MPSMTIKSMPDRIYSSLKRSAKLSHRSLNGEAIACLERSLGLSRTMPEDRLSRIDALRSNIKDLDLNEEILSKAKSEGRP